MGARVFKGTCKCKIKMVKVKFVAFLTERMCEFGPRGILQQVYGKSAAQLLINIRGAADFHKYSSRSGNSNRRKGMKSHIDGKEFFSKSITISAPHCCHTSRFDMLFFWKLDCLGFFICCI